MNMMQTFLEGFMSFISPCMLPMLPVYAAYFSAGEPGRKTAFARAGAFVLGFTVVFVLLGVFAGTLGTALAEHRRTVNIVCGFIVMLMGCGYLGWLWMPFKGMNTKITPTGVFSAFVFGLVFSVCLTPCVGAFLGAALMLAASEGGAARGAALLLSYSAGLGVPFMVSAMLIDELKGVFAFVKRKYAYINPVFGALLLVWGFRMCLPDNAKADQAGAAKEKPAAEASASAASAKADGKGNDSIKEKKAMETELTSANFAAEVLESDKPVLVDFWAPWCGPCRMLAPVVAEIAKEKAGTLKVCKVNVDEAPELAAKYGVNSIPALFLFKNGAVAARGVGFMPKAKLEEFVSQ